MIFCDDPQTTQINRQKKCNNFPCSKIMMLQTFIQVWSLTTLDCRHVVDWEKVTGCHDLPWTVTSLATRVRSGIMDNPRLWDKFFVPVSILSQSLLTNGGHQSMSLTVELTYWSWAWRALLTVIPCIAFSFSSIQARLSTKWSGITWLARLNCGCCTVRVVSSLGKITSC